MDENGVDNNSNYRTYRERKWKARTHNIVACNDLCLINKFS